jgi:midasin
MEVPGQGRIEASEHFAIFATRSIPARDGRYSKPTFLSAHKLHEIIHPTPTREELQVIADFKFPVLAGAPAHAAIRLWECVCAIEVTESTSARAVGIRELEKFCARLERLLPHNTGIGSMVGREIKLSDIVSNPTLREEIYLEARDVFFGSGTLTAAARLHTERVAFIVGDHLDLTVERQSWLLHNRIPELDIEKDINGKIVALRICRNRMASMPVMEVVSSPSRPFAMHRPAVSLLSRLSNAIVLSEPVLLTGETGTGKTSIVTHLASLLRKPLISLNLSNQTESSDLLGGFKPIDARVPGSELQAKFIQLFGGTFSRKKNAKFEESVRKAVLENKWKRAVVLWFEAIKLAKSRILSRNAEMDLV